MPGSSIVIQMFKIDIHIFGLTNQNTVLIVVATVEQEKDNLKR